MRLGVWAAVLALASPLPAAAKIVRVTHSGIVASDGYDITGVFGAPDTSLDGVAYRGVLVFDTGLGTLESAPTYVALIGGGQFGTSNPVVSATLTIKGISFAITPDYFGEANSAHYTAPMFTPLDVQFHGVRHNFFDGVNQENDFFQNLISVEGDNTGLPFSIDTPFGYRVQPNDAVSGAFEIFHCCDSDGNAVWASGSLIPQYIQVSVPEPGNWAMLIAGFGLTGAVQRRRRLRRA